MVPVYCADSRCIFQADCSSLASFNLHGGEQIAFLSSACPSTISRLVGIHFVFHAKPNPALLRTIPILQLTSLLPYHNRNYSPGVPCNLHFRLPGPILPLHYLGYSESFVWTEREGNDQRKSDKLAFKDCIRPNQIQTSKRLFHLFWRLLARWKHHATFMRYKTLLPHWMYSNLDERKELMPTMQKRNQRTKFVGVLKLTWITCPDWSSCNRLRKCSSN